MHIHRLLIVEDDHATRNAFGGIFSRMGWLVRLAATAAEGIEWIDAGHEPCCLILDLNLPDGNGEQVLALARSNGLRSYIAVCTAVDDPARLATVQAMNRDAMLVKPITLSHVCQDVCRVVDQHSSTTDLPTIK